ncbi:MAG: hypothetical protein ACNA7W_18785 [Pseudomonadales bacterium]
MSEAIQQSNEPSLRELAINWLTAKALEGAANHERIRIEQQMLPFLEQKAEGSVTSDVDGFKVTVTNRVNRKLDPAVWSAVGEQIPAELRPIKTRIELDDVGVRWLMNNEPELYAIVATAITATPAKPGIKVTPAKEEE